MLARGRAIACEAARLHTLFGALALCCALTEVAHAHGPPPSPLSLLAVDAHGARAVRLSRGIALRGSDGMRFVCPAAWGATDAEVVVAGAIPNGPLVIAGSTSLFLIADDGTVTPHPDARGIGRVIALAASSSALYALQVRADQSELIEVGAERVRLLWSDAQSWIDLAASDAGLLLLRLGQAELVQLELTSDGEVKDEQQALAPDMTAALFARLVDSTPYVLAATTGGAQLELGRVQDGEFRVLQTARANLAGPIETSGGRRFVAIEGVLNAFDDDEAEALDEAALVTCLDTVQGRHYACTRSAIRELDDDGLGDTLFDLSRLLQPNPRLVPDAAAPDCDAQWQHYRFDLVAAGITPAEEPDAGGAVDSGIAVPLGDAGLDAGTTDDAGDAGATPEPRSTRDDSGCSATRATGTTRPISAGWVALLSALLGHRRRQRRRRNRAAIEQRVQVLA